MTTQKPLFLAGVALLSIFVAALMLRATARSTNGSEAASIDLEPHAQASELAHSYPPVRESLEQASAIESTPTPANGAQETYSATRDGAEWSAIFSLLSDPLFLEASTFPHDQNSQLLESLIARADLAIDPVVAIEMDARFSAGVSQRLTEYVPGEPFSTKSRNLSLITSYFMVDDIAHLVELPRGDYQDLYSVSDGRLRMQKELDLRRRKELLDTEEARSK